MKYRLLLILILFSLMIGFTGITYSMFTSESSFTIRDMQIAEFIFETERTDHIELDFADLKPGEFKEFSFKVTNAKDDIVTNVTTEYQIIINTFHFMPLLIELYKGDELVMTCDENYLRNADNALLCNSDIWEMDYSSIETEDFKVKVTFPSKYNSYEYTDLVDFIDIHISSWQKLG